MSESIKEYFKEKVEFDNVSSDVLKFINRYITDNIDALTEKSFTESVVFGEQKKQEILGIYGFDESSWKKFKRNNKMLRKYNKPHLTEPLYHLLILSYKFESDDERAKKFIYFMAIKVYSSKYNNFFKYGVNEERMEYTINNLSKRFGIKKHGSVLKMIKEKMNKFIEHYHKPLNRVTDKDIIDNGIIVRVYNRIGDMVKKIANKYYDTEEMMWKDEEIQDDENLRLTTNDSLKLENLKNNIKSQTVNYGMDDKILRQIDGMKYKKDFRRMFQNDSKDLSQLYSIIIDDYTKKANSSGIKHAKEYGFARYFKKSRKKDERIKEKINEFTDEYNTGNKVEFRKKLRQYMVVVVHRTLQKL